MPVFLQINNRKKLKNGYFLREGTHSVIILLFILTDLAFDYSLPTKSLPYAIQFRSAIN
jgi:hypothetical protein